MLKLFRAYSFNQSVVFDAVDFSSAENDLVKSLTVGIDFIKCGEILSTPLPLNCSRQAPITSL
jgi:hypothetical protein